MFVVVLAGESILRYVRRTIINWLVCPTVASGHSRQAAREMVQGRHEVSRLRFEFLNGRATRRNHWSQVVIIDLLDAANNDDGNDASLVISLARSDYL